ncbi:MAG: PilZ domain-containing protein [Chromatiaceae bacterium]
MTSERRYSARHPIALTVQIVYGRRRFCGAQAGDLSNQGMCLTLRNLTLPVGTLVDLEFACLGREWVIEAVVVYRSGSNVGVMFREPQPVLYQTLLQGLIPGTADQTSGAPRSSMTRERPLLARH